MTRRDLRRLAPARQGKRGVPTSVQLHVRLPIHTIALLDEYRAGILVTTGLTVSRQRAVEAILARSLEASHGQG